MRSYRRFSRLLLKSFIISERKSLLTSISSELGEEFFNRVATTFKITERQKSDNVERREERREMKEKEKQIYKKCFGLKKIKCEGQGECEANQ